MLCAAISVAGGAATAICIPMLSLCLREAGSARCEVGCHAGFDLCHCGSAGGGKQMQTDDVNSNYCTP